MDAQKVAAEVWDSHGDEAYRQDQSHWRGVGRWANDAAWQSIGKGTLINFQTLARYLDRPFPTAPSMLEWGPGGGTNLFAFRKIASTYFGIDISAKNLAEASRMISAEPDASVRFMPVLLETAPADIVGKVSGVDLFLSTAVFQHFPEKAYGAEVLRVLRSVCVPRAFGIIQIRYDNGNPLFKPIATIADYKTRHITANSYAIDEFNDLATEAGFRVCYVTDIRSKNNYVTFALEAR